MLIPVSALSSWIYCPVQFYQSYVLGIEEVPKDVMILGLIKHKLHENITKEEQKLVTELKKTDNVQEKLHTTYVQLLRTIVTEHSNALRTVKVPLTTAFQKALPIAKFEAEDRTSVIIPLLEKGLTGEQLWNAITPKVKTEYSLQSEKLGLKGRIDRLECHETKILPVELKSGNPPKEGVWDGHRIQATAYALMLEDKFSVQVPEAIIHYIDHNSRRTIVLNPFMKEEVIDTTKKVRECIETKELPKGCGKCPACNDLKAQQKGLNISQI
ncbi:Uncharacterised protein [uncultured archaeon]|nr:Uncharacterised protein [uncultured archaeon]